MIFRRLYASRFPILLLILLVACPLFEQIRLLMGISDLDVMLDAPMWVVAEVAALAEIMLVALKLTKYSVPPATVSLGDSDCLISRWNQSYNNLRKRSHWLFRPPGAAVLLFILPLFTMYAWFGTETQVVAAAFGLVLFNVLLRVYSVFDRLLDTLEVRLWKQRTPTWTKRTLGRLSIALAVAYVAAYWLSRGTALPGFVPLGIIGVFIGLVLTMTSIHLDRLGVPVFTPFVVFTLVGASFLSVTPHYDLLSVPIDPQPLRAKDIVNLHGGTSIVVVAASGGGAHAADWAASVLLRLNNVGWPDLDEHPRFSERVRAMSGVSGGSVGMMHFVNGTWNGPSQKFIDQTDYIYNAVRRASLHDVAWGFAYPSAALRLIDPRGGGLHDAGNRLERGWENCYGCKSIGKTLRDWKAETWSAGKPAMLFSATMAETGQSFTFCSCDFHSPSGSGRLTFSDSMPRHDVRVRTAVRLSASFPWLTPPSLGATGQGPYLADGGFADNTAVLPLLDFLSDALESGARMDRLLFIRIEAYPRKRRLGAGDFENYRERHRPALPAFWDLGFPFLTGYQSLFELQIQRSDEALDAFRRKYGNKIYIDEVRFTYPGEPILSWALEPGQHSKAIQAAEEQIPESKKENWLKVMDQSSPGGRVHNFLRVDELTKRTRDSHFAQLMLGLAYESGTGTFKDLVKSTVLFEMASKGTDKESADQARDGLERVKKLLAASLQN